MKKQLPLLLIMTTLSMAACIQTSKELLPGKTSMRPADEMVMVYVPGGEFQMGSSEAEVESAFDICTDYWDECNLERFRDELPSHDVVLDEFWIDQTEITNDQYHKCVAAQKCGEPLCWAGLQFDDPDQPVVCVTWDQAQAYCEWVGGRLPTEAEWEFAARGPAGFQYPWGNSFVGARLNYCDETCGRDRSDIAWNDGWYYTAPVGQYLEGASWCGALDLAGNVLEWVGDWYGDYDSQRSVNPSGPASGRSRVVRGGSWFQTRVETRSAWRDGLLPDSWFDDLGFRCVIPDFQEGD